MYSSTTSQFMDKQIMDLSNFQSTATGNNSSDNDFIDFMNRPPEKKDDIFPRYDFMPIRPAVGSSSPPPPATRSSNIDFGEEDAPFRTWNSFDSKTNASPIRNYSSLDANEPAKFILGKSHKPVNASLDASLVSEIDRTMKKYVDNLMHAVDGMSARLSQLETRTRNLENSMDDLKVSLGNNHGSTDGKIRQVENILREVQTGVQVIRDKQEVVEAQLHVAKLVPKVEQEVESRNTPHIDSAQPGASANQQFSTVSLTQPPPTLPPPNAPPPQQNLQPQVQLPNQFPQKQVPSVPQRESYFPPPGQTPENPSLQYQIPPPHQHQHPPAPPSQHQYQSHPQPEYSQTPPPSQLHPSFTGVNPSLPQLPSGHPPDEAPYTPPQTYPPGIRPPSSRLSSGVPHAPSQQFYGPLPNVYEAPSSKPGPGYSGPFGPTSGHGEPYPYGSPVKPQQLYSLMGQSGGSGYPQLPTTRILPQALPTASGTGGGSGSGGSGNKVPIDDVVDKVTNMGFPRDQVRTMVRKLTENGQSVDLNVVLDKLMNDGDGQAPRGICQPSLLS
ncbi:hypothetical protein Pfo_019689 [Paulownia fortunei]|nr:hypothetical protein Pfo_019689 [Paulownia fortunei]